MAMDLMKLQMFDKIFMQKLTMMAQKNIIQIIALK